MVLKTHLHSTESLRCHIFCCNCKLRVKGGVSHSGFHSLPSALSQRLPLRVHQLAFSSLASTLLPVRRLHSQSIPFKTPRGAAQCEHLHLFPFYRTRMWNDMYTERTAWGEYSLNWTESVLTLNPSVRCCSKTSTSTLSFCAQPLEKTQTYVVQHNLIDLYSCMNN